MQRAAPAPSKACHRTVLCPMPRSELPGAQRTHNLLLSPSPKGKVRVLLAPLSKIGGRKAALPRMPCPPAWSQPLFFSGLLVPPHGCQGKPSDSPGKERPETEGGNSFRLLQPEMKGQNHRGYQINIIIFKKGGVG